MARANKTMRCKKLYIKPSERKKAFSRAIRYPKYLLVEDGGQGSNAFM